MCEWNVYNNGINENNFFLFRQQSGHYFIINIYNVSKKPLVWVLFKYLIYVNGYTKNWNVNNGSRSHNE